MFKNHDAFRTISEVALELDLPQHVLRFWETRFSQIKPMKRSGGRRYYRSDEVELISAIKTLLYGQGYTIKGVQRLFKEIGVRELVALAREGKAVFPIPVEPPAETGEPDQARVGALSHVALPLSASLPNPAAIPADLLNDLRGVGRTLQECARILRSARV